MTFTNDMGHYDALYKWSPEIQDISKKNALESIIYKYVWDKIKKDIKYYNEYHDGICYQYYKPLYRYRSFKIYNIDIDITLT